MEDKWSMSIITLIFHYCRAVIKGMWSGTLKLKIRNMHRKREMFFVYFNNHIVSRVIFSTVRLWWYKNIMRFVIGTGTSILTDFKVSQRGNLEIGDHSVVNNSCRFDNRFPIRVGNNVSISYGTHILTKGHDMNSPKFSTIGKGVVIEDYSWICSNAILLPGVNIGKGAVVLTAAVVTKDAIEYSVVGGNPAKTLSTRAKELHYELNWNPWVPFWG